jgi:cytochrome oxidase Cu insertion factor (SCO1/SenC/PrrC family)
MGTRFILAAVFAVLIANTTVLAQLGPKDGADLSPTDLNRIKVGQPAPDFSLEDVNNKTITLSEFREKKTVVLVFYRGYW